MQNINSTKLISNIAKSIKNVLNEYYVSMKNSEHNYDDFLDDDDFLEIVNRVTYNYDAEDFLENDDTDEIEMDIADLIHDFITDEALDEWGYKYGTVKCRRVASNIIKYIKSHIDTLY